VPDEKSRREVDSNASFVCTQLPPDATAADLGFWRDTVARHAISEAYGGGGGGGGGRGKGGKGGGGDDGFAGYFSREAWQHVFNNQYTAGNTEARGADGNVVYGVQVVRCGDWHTITLTHTREHSQWPATSGSHERTLTLVSGASGPGLPTALF
jgi:hypothetical protein